MTTKRNCIIQNSFEMRQLRARFLNKDKTVMIKDIQAKFCSFKQKELQLDPISRISM